MLTTVFPQRSEVNFNTRLDLFSYWISLFIITIYFFRHVSVLRGATTPTALRYTAETDAKMAKTRHINVSLLFWNCEFTEILFNNDEITTSSASEKSMLTLFSTAL